MQTNSQFDYIIVGAGLSGLHLSYSLSRDEYFKDCSILIIDKKTSKKTDNYFSFWEIGKGKWDKILKNKWLKGNFFSKTDKIEMDFSLYNYKTLSSVDFKNHVKNELKKNKKFKFIDDLVLKTIQKENKVIVVGEKKTYYAKHVFDSRFTLNINKELNKYTSLKQHFLGWVIRTNENKFEKDSLTFMDYRIRDKSKTAFTYILPFKDNEALIEHTYFSKEECLKEVYEGYIKEYLKKYYSISNYKIIKSEYGVIPMTTYPFYKDSSKNITKIGTAGGWVKPSTGYSFKNCEKYSKTILENIKKGKDIRIVPKKRYYFLDKILLGVISKYNYRGENIFYRMIKRNPTKKVLKFLNEESTFLEISKIVISMRSIYFVLIFFRSLFNKRL